MKKSLIALAVAGAMTAPMIAQADATLYGYLETRLTADEDSDLQVAATKVGLGVRGVADNDFDGLETGYQMEMRFKAGNSNADSSDPSEGETEVHKANAWLEGGFGRLTAGLQNNPAERGVWSISNRANATFIDQQDNINNALVYTTPNMGGLELEVGIAMDASMGGGEDIVLSNGKPGKKDGDDVDVAVFGANYSIMGLNLGLGYANYEGADDDETSKDGGDIISVQANYSIDALTLGASWQERDYDNNVQDVEGWLVGAGFAFGKASVYGEWTERDFDNAGDDEGYVIGARYKLGSKAMVQLETAQFDEKGDLTTLEYQLNF
ncbi:porin [Motiliproteus sp. SC1-56]|uniref:porin n=1 Tax=Motiliproteus sp. SC1-56 TaxID=2799565 RepID=UPI001A8C2348|nr:porin [Motiliproteus sp. SC1-56]